jgi:hypothetical protein
MTKEKIKKRHNPGEHFWKGLVEHIESAEIFNIEEENLERDIKILKRLEKDNYFRIKKLPAREKNITPFLEYIELLKNFNLDIGKGECEYGYQMPLVEKGKPYRYLKIFKRR